MNKYISNMENEIWERHGNNTNVAEAAHAQANREGKQLKLITAIMRLIFYCIFNLSKRNKKYVIYKIYLLISN